MVYPTETCCKPPATAGFRVKRFTLSLAKQVLNGEMDSVIKTIERNTGLVSSTACPRSRDAETPERRTLRRYESYRFSAAVQTFILL